MPLGALVDQYCERVGPGLLAEPLNLISNLSFLLAGCAALRARSKWLKPGHRAQRPAGYLAWLIIAIAIGSSLFHSVATIWAMVLDVGPIALFLFSYLAILTRTFLAWSWRSVALAMSGFVALTSVPVVAFSPTAFGGSTPYFGAAIALIVIAILVSRVHRTAGRLYAFAAAAFLLSLVFRSVDATLCVRFPNGTHFLWHMLNGLVLYLVFRAALALTRNRDNSPPSVRAA